MLASGTYSTWDLNLSDYRHIIVHNISGLHKHIWKHYRKALKLEQHKVPTPRHGPKISMTHLRQRLNGANITSFETCF